MTIYNGQVPQLLQGVSQQPQHARADGQLGAQLNCVSDIVQGLRRRPGSQFKALTGVLPASCILPTTATHSYDRGDGTASWTVLVGADGTVRVVNLLTGAIITPSGAVGTYLSTGALPANRRFRFHTIGDTTFIVNTEQTAVMAATTSPALQKLALVHVKAASYGRTYDVIINGTVQATHTTPSAVVLAAGEVHKTIGLDATTIAETLRAALQASIGATYNITRQGSIIRISHATTGFVIACQDGNNNNDMMAITYSVREPADLPPFAPSGYRLEVKGKGDTEYGGFWVQWVQHPPTNVTHWAATGYWEECIGPGTQTTINPAFMPVELKQTVLAPPAFTLSAPTWGLRAAGTSVTNPVPSFIGSQIRDIGTYQNRLYMLTGENVVMSRAFDYKQFFAESVAAPSDDDPVDSASADNQVTDLLYGVVFNKDLVIFSHNAQFVHPGSTPVTPTTFAVVASTKFNVSPEARPVVTGTSILFPAKDGAFTNVWEYRVDNLTDRPQCESITRHVPRYINGTVYQIEADPSTGYVFVRTANNIFVLQQHHKDTNRVQLSWHVWDHDVAPFSWGIIGSTVYSITNHTGISNNALETVDLTLQRSPWGLGVELFLDHQHLRTVEAGAWVVGGTAYSYRVNIQLNPTSPDYLLIHTSVMPNPGMRVLDAVLDGGWWYFNVEGAAPPNVIVGLPFESAAVLTLPFVKDTAGRPYVGDATLNHVGLVLEQTGYIETTVNHKAGVPYTQVFNGIIINNHNYVIGEAALLDVLESVPVLDLRELVELSVSSDHHLGFNIVALDWELDMITRGRRSQ